MNTSDYTTGPQYIDWLYDQGMIDEPIFSFYIGDTNEQSYVDIGFMDEKALKGGSIITSGFIWLK
jgi:hypothetical protein